MSKVLWKGVGFGLTSGVITTLGVIIGLHSGTRSKTAILVGITVVAVADAFSDAMGIHVSEEAESEHTTEEIWKSAFFTFMSKLFISLSFVIPMTFFELSSAILASIVWGLFLIVAFSFFMAKTQNKTLYKVVLEHFLVAVSVVFLTHYLGEVIHESIGA